MKMQERHQVVGFISSHVLAQLIDLPAGTFLVKTMGSFDPPGIVLVLENADWPAIMENVEAPRVLLSVDLLRVNDNTVTPTWPTHDGDAHLFGRIRVELPR